MKDLLFVAKTYMHVSNVENLWLRWLVMHQNPQVQFSNNKQMVQHAIPSLVAKTMDKYVLPTLDSCVPVTTSFDLQISRFGHNTFILVINFINSLWVPCHVTMGLFEVIDMVGIEMVTQVKDLLSFYNLLEKIIIYVKD